MKKLFPIGLVAAILAFVAVADPLLAPVIVSPSISGGSINNVSITGGSISGVTGAGSGTVTSVAVTAANGVSCSTANPTTTPNLTCSLGAITPTSVNGNTIQAGNGVFGLASGGTFKTSGVGGSITLAVSGVSSVNVPASGTLEQETIDVFLIAGQSNAMGVGNSTLSPTVPSGQVLQYYGGIIKDANDPVGAASTGSAWPSFGLSYNLATHRKILFVPAAVGGTTVLAASDTGAGNWSPTGVHFGNSVAAVTAAMNAVTASGYTPKFSGVLWDQGETDAEGINNALITQAQFEAGLTSVITRYRAQYGAEMPFYLGKTGRDTGGNASGYSQIQAGEENVIAADLHGRICFRGAQDFIARGMMAPASTVHYSQAAYNEMGRIWASNVLSALGNDSAKLPQTIAYTNTASSGTELQGLTIKPTYNQTGTAGSTDFLIDRTETVIGSGAHYFAIWKTPTTSFSVSNVGSIGITSNTPFYALSANITGTGANGIRLLPYSDGNTYWQHDGGMVWSAYASVTPQMKLDTSGNLTLAGRFARGYVTVTGTPYALAATDTNLTVNYAGTEILTLPAATLGSELYIRTITANLVQSNAANVVPLAGGAASQNILAATAGKWAHLVGDGTYWQTMAAN